MGLQKTSFENGLSKVRRKLIAVKWEYEQTERALLRGNMKDSYDCAFALAAQVEKLALLTRDLPAHTGNPKAPFDLYDMLLENCGVDVGYTKEGWFSVRMPILLPKKGSGSADYIRTMLYPSLHSFFQNNTPVYLDRCVIVFRHVYKRNRPERSYRDHDNIELNMVVDLMAMFSIKDDSPARCRHYYCSAVGNEDRTEVYTVPFDDFQNWILFEKSCNEVAFPLLQTPPKQPEKDM